MISAGTHTGVWIDLGNDAPGLVLQRLDGGLWQDVIKDGEPVLSPVKIDSLPPGKYRLV